MLSHVQVRLTPAALALAFCASTRAEAQAAGAATSAQPPPQASPHPVGVLESARKHRIRSDLASFVEGYRELKLGNFGRAKEVFEEAAKAYDATAVDFGFLLPYLALAEVKAGDTTSIEKRLHDIPPLRHGFDYQLARAIVAAAAGKNEEAFEALNLARYRRPFTETRVDLTQYTLGEVSEMLAASTRDPKIHDLALEWARSSQVFEPWHAWSYAIAAGLERDPERRGRAIAMAHYLDPNSERQSNLSKAQIEAAVEAFGRSNPFTTKAPSPKSAEAHALVRSQPAALTALTPTLSRSAGEGE